MKGRFDSCRTLLDVGCGGGRNLRYFLQNEMQVYGIDQHPQAIDEVKKLSSELSANHHAERFQVALAEEMPFEDNTFDCILCNAVLHFAKDRPHFDAMLLSIWRVLKPKGFLFVRLASEIGIEHLITSLGNGRYRLPDGSERYLVNETMLLDYAKTLNGSLCEYIKTTNVQHFRCMTTWCLYKNE